MPVIIIKILCGIAVVGILFLFVVGFIYSRMDRQHSMAEITWNRMRPYISNWIDLVKDLPSFQAKETTGVEEFSSMIAEFQNIKKSSPRNASLLNSIHQKVIYYTYDWQTDPALMTEKAKISSAWDNADFVFLRGVYNNHVKRYYQEALNPISKKLIRLLRIYPLTTLDE